ncbi:MAG: hypothetical protein M5U15_15370 [Kiritimatiellae bacterium]|nr:hypothetical protein [Kiritimatiellia bacterium]
MALTSRKKRSSNVSRLWRSSGLSSCGRVKTTWKYGAGISSRMRRASHFSRAAPWQVGQCRSRQEL